jgi:hypothetical protein
VLAEPTLEDAFLFTMQGGAAAVRAEKVA